jgi:hypothetical protein
VDQNVAAASHSSWLSAEEQARVRAAADENQKFMDLYCTGCAYCIPCPHEVNIPRIFEAMNLKTVWGLEKPARNMYAEIGTNPWVKGNRADACVECGECEPKCPQKIPIISQLAEARIALE